MKIEIPNTLRLLLSLSGALIVSLSILIRGKMLTTFTWLGHPVFIVIGIILFALGLYNSKTGFKGVGQSNSSDDPSPGASTGKQSGGLDSDGGFGGGGE